MFFHQVPQLKMNPRYECFMEYAGTVLQRAARHRDLQQRDFDGIDAASLQLDMCIRLVVREKPK